MIGREFIEWLKAAEIHWFFVQVEQALERGLYLPSTMGLINGIEASIRITLHQLDRKSLDDELGATLSNPLIGAARDRGLPVSRLAFPTEPEFDVRLGSKQPYVEVMRLRHNFAHGNFVEFVNRDLDFFTPECLRDVAGQLLSIAGNWVQRPWRVQGAESSRLERRSKPSEIASTRSRLNEASFS